MTLRSKLIRLAHENPALRKDILPLLRSKTASSTNPTVSLWSKEDRTYAVKMSNPRKGEMFWTGDGWKHSMDFVREDTPKLFPSENSAKNAIVKEVLPYIFRWQPGWEDYLRGWEMPKTAAEAPTVKEIVRLGRSPIKADRTSYEKMMIRLWDRKGRDSFSYNPAGGEADDVDLLDVKDAIELPKVSGVGRVAVVKKRYGGTTIEVGRREGYYWRWYVLLEDS